MLTDTTLAPSAPQGAVNHPALAATHWHDGCDARPYGVERSRVLAPLAAAYYQGGAAAVIKAASGSNHCDVRACWALAMTVVHGPVGMHPTQEQHPEVLRIKANTKAELERRLGV